MLRLPSNQQDRFPVLFPPPMKPLNQGFHAEAARTLDLHTEETTLASDERANPAILVPVRRGLDGQLPSRKDCVLMRTYVCWP